MRYLTIIAALLVVGCSKATMTRPIEDTPMPAAWYKLSSYSNIVDFRLDDGTRCIALVGSEGRGGIDCDFRKQEIEK